MSDYGPQVKLARLYEKTSKTGNQHFVGAQGRVHKPVHVAQCLAIELPVGVGLQAIAVGADRSAAQAKVGRHQRTPLQIPQIKSKISRLTRACGG